MDPKPGLACSNKERHGKTTQAAKQILTRAIGGCTRNGKCFPLSAAAADLTQQPPEVCAVAARSTVDRYSHHWSTHAAGTAHPPPDNSCRRCGELIEEICSWFVSAARSCAAVRGLLGGNDWLAAAARRTECLRHKNGGTPSGLPLAARLHLERHLLCKWYVDRQLWASRGGGPEPWNRVEAEARVFNCNRLPLVSEECEQPDHWQSPPSSQQNNPTKDRFVRKLIDADLRVLTDGGGSSLGLVNKISSTAPSQHCWTPGPVDQQFASCPHSVSPCSLSAPDGSLPSRPVRRTVRGGAKHRAKRERRLARLEAAAGGSPLLENPAGHGTAGN